MPQGKGTYGSKVGRPPKKYQAGGMTGETEAVLDAAMKGQELKSISLEGIPTENAPDRSEASPMGDEVGTGMYKKGGKVEKTKKKVFTGEKDITDVVKAVDKKLKKEKAEWKEHTIFGPQFKKGVS